jgi:hypothetical protein
MEDRNEAWRKMLWKEEKMSLHTQDRDSEYPFGMQSCLCVCVSDAGGILAR